MIMDFPTSLLFGGGKKCFGFNGKVIFVRARMQVLRILAARLCNCKAITVSLSKDLIDCYGNYGFLRKV